MNLDSSYSMPLTIVKWLQSEKQKKLSNSNSFRCKRRSKRIKCSNRNCEMLKNSEAMLRVSMKQLQKPWVKMKDNKMRSFQKSLFSRKLSIRSSRSSMRRFFVVNKC